MPSLPGLEVLADGRQITCTCPLLTRVQEHPGLPEPMDRNTRYRLARASYLSLFVVAPAVALFFILGASASNAGICFGTLVALAVIGEHGLRPWKRLWKVEG